MEEVDILKKLILQKLIRSNIWGGKHTPLDFILKGVPNQYRNTSRGKRAISEALKVLINAGFVMILMKRTGKDSDEHISLNPKKISEINQFLQNTVQ